MDLPFIGMTLPEMIQTVGYVGVFVMVFIESGVPIGIVLPLPGDTLLFSAGLLAATSVFDLVPLIITIIVAAILGDSTGYWFGSQYGPKLFTKDDALILNKKHIDRAEAFYKRFGRMAIIIARFIPMLRTIIPIFAGVGKMHYPTFLIFNVIGAVVWALSVTLLGYYMGSMIPNVDTYLLPILLVVVLLTTLPVIHEILENRKARKGT